MSKVLMLLRGYEENLSHKGETIQEKRLKQMLYWIDVHYMEKVKVDDIASSAGVCARECQRTFTKVLGDIPIKYLLKRRILIAASMIKTSNASINEIALQCGFENQSYFTKQFHQMMEVTPKEYMRIERKSNS